MSQQYEFKHVTCAPSRVQKTIDLHSIFFWEVIGTDSMSSSYLTREASALYSVVEQTTNINLRRKTALPNLDTIKEAERNYFDIREQLSQIEIPSWTAGRVCIAFAGIFMLYVIPGVLYILHVNKKSRKGKLRLQELEAEMDKLIEKYKSILNVGNNQSVLRSHDVFASKISK